jgi:hypothetical protein
MRLCAERLACRRLLRDASPRYQRDPRRRSDHRIATAHGRLTQASAFRRSRDDLRRPRNHKRRTRSPLPENRFRAPSDPPAELQDQPAYHSNLFGIFGAAAYFRSIRSDPITLALGLNVRNGEERSEIDLTVLVQERGEPARQKPTTVFVEAKGLAQKLDDDDIASFKWVLHDFLRAYLRVCDSARRSC